MCVAVETPRGLFLQHCCFRPWKILCTAFHTCLVTAASGLCVLGFSNAIIAYFIYTKWLCLLPFQLKAIKLMFEMWRVIKNVLKWPNRLGETQKVIWNLSARFLHARTMKGKYFLKPFFSIFKVLLESFVSVLLFWVFHWRE